MSERRVRAALRRYDRRRRDTERAQLRERNALTELQQATADEDEERSNLVRFARTVMPEEMAE